MTSYTVEQQTKIRQCDSWSRTTWQVVAKDQDNARTEAREVAMNSGLIVGECFSVTKG